MIIYSKSLLKNFTFFPQSKEFFFFRGMSQSEGTKQTSESNPDIELSSARQTIPSNQRSRKKIPFHRKFTKEEDKYLLALVSRYGERAWQTVASMMNTGRTSRQCRERYKYYLSSASQQKKEWTREEDELLLSKYKQLGPKWALLSSFFDGRTDINLKNRYRRIMRKQNRSSPIAGSALQQEEDDNNHENSGNLDQKMDASIFNCETNEISTTNDQNTFNDTQNQCENNNNNRDMNEPLNSIQKEICEITNISEYSNHSIVYINNCENNEKLSTFQNISNSPSNFNFSNTLTNCRKQFFKNLNLFDKNTIDEMNDQNPYNDKKYPIGNTDILSAIRSSSSCKQTINDIQLNQKEFANFLDGNVFNKYHNDTFQISGQTAMIEGRNRNTFVNSEGNEALQNSLLIPKIDYFDEKSQNSILKTKNDSSSSCSSDQSSPIGSDNENLMKIGQKRKMIQIPMPISCLNF
ncbi:hypothetical protein TRFO_15059 [Tritrichomonas foetus]|uniref:Myb-like DNA-binding domain containing protein n=1 Tax=Tritrichomonas foetus TaxID=1144522 RepID=A0A1J4KYA3_9EUKA|nr:hypothetical protein TRFO_15059 [Tritrichomonas foetus]|eukprot:OHT14533.1 hypothetical protein TRFO_15059 [Tritrichomonas foetus]